MPFHDSTSGRQSDARAREIGMTPREGLEHAISVFWGNPDPVVANMYYRSV